MGEAASTATAATTLREPVLAGRYFGSRHAETARGLGQFAIDEPGAALARWYGPRRAASLLLDAEALRGALDRDIAAIDALLSAQVDAILHAPRLRRLEGSWRGLAWLAERIAPGARVKLRLLPIAWAETCRDLERAVEFDQSNLFRRVYEDEFGMPGGEPFGLLLVDHEMRHHPSPDSPTDDVAAIGRLAAIGAAAFAVVVLGVSPALLGVDAFGELAVTASPTSPLQAPSHARWRGLAARDDARFLCAVLPHALARLPYGDHAARQDGFRYLEYAPDARARVWMSAVYPFAATVTRAFATHAWPADIRGVDADREGGAVVTGLPVEWFGAERATAWPRPPLDLVLGDAQERELVAAGLMPLVSLPYGPQAAFAAVGSLQRPERYTGPNAEAANANARLSTQINGVLCAARFAHYIKVIGRDLVGSLQTAERLEQRLQAWLNRFVNAAINAGPETRARQPLSAGRVSLQELPGRPGAFGCTLHLQPHFQLDELATTFRLVTEIAGPGARA